MVTAFVVLDGFVARQVVHGGLVQREEVVRRHRPAGFHHLHRKQQHARAVVANHRLGQAVRLLGLGRRANLQAGMPMMYAWNGCECSAPRDWFGAVPPAPMTVMGMSNCPPVVAYVFPADESSAMP